MKRVITAALVILNGLGLVAADSIIMTIAYEDKEQPPYYMGNTMEVLASNPGVAVEMVKAVEKRVPNLVINLVRAPWKRCTTQLGDGQYDGIFNASYSPDRLAIGWYPTKNGAHDGPVDASKRITTITYSLYTPIKSNVKWDGKQFRNQKGDIGAPRGYSIVNDLKLLGASVVEVPGTANALDMLAANRVSAAALQAVSADQLIAKYPRKYGKIKKLDMPLASKPYYLMLSNKFVKTNPDIAQKIWTALREIRIKEFAKLVSNYSE